MQVQGGGETSVAVVMLVLERQIERLLVCLVVTQYEEI